MAGKAYPRLSSSYDTTKSRYYIMDLRTGEVIDFPFPPETMNERPNTPSFSSETVIGRTSQFVNYISSDNRTISFTAIITDDYIDKPLIEIRDTLASMSMPDYNSYQITPPNVQVKLGSNTMRGVLTGLTFDWSGPYRDGVRTILTVGFEVKETRDIPLSSSQVRAGGWSNG
jgi:hypothetical protein